MVGYLYINREKEDEGVAAQETHNIGDDRCTVADGIDTSIRLRRRRMKNQQKISTKRLILMQRCDIFHYYPYMNKNEDDKQQQKIQFLLLMHSFDTTLQRPLHNKIQLKLLGNTRK